MRILFLLVLACTPLLAETIPESEEKPFRASYCAADPGDVNFDVRRCSYQPLPASSNFGFTQQIYWIKIEVENATESREKFWLEIAYPPLDNITLFEPSDEGYRTRVTGDTLPFHSREVYHRNYIFPILISPGISTFYLRAQTESSMQIPLHLWTEQGLLRKINIEQFVFGIFYGLMLVMLVYNLFVYASVRDSSYLYYILYIASFSFFQMSLNGLAFQYVWPDFPWWGNRSVPVSMAFGAFWILQFSRTFLQFRRHIRPIHFVSLGLQGLLVVSMVLTMFVHYAVAIRVATALVLVVSGVILISGIIVFVKGYKPARFFMLAWTALLLGAVLAALKALGILPGIFVTEYGIQIGSAMEVVLLSFALADRINILKEERESVRRDSLENKLRMLDSFSRFVPKQFLKFLNRESIVEVDLGDSAEMQMSVMFTDIRSFTTLSETMTIEENFRFLNAYLKRMGPIIQQNNGFVDKFIGDAIMALFPRSPDHALDAAVNMMRELARYNAHRSQSGYQPIQAGIGIHHGPLMLGTVGSVSRIETTVIGDTVNLCARLESLTKNFNASIIISDVVYRAVSDPEKYATREIDSVLVRGKKRPIVLYEVFESDPDDLRAKKIDTAPRITAAMSVYKAGDFEDARKAFQDLHDENPDDGLPALYLKRCDRLLIQPPVGRWTGITRMR